MFCFRKHLRKWGSFRGGKSFIKLKKPSLQLSLSKFVVKSMKTVLGSKLNESDRLTDSCIWLVLKCRFGSDTSLCCYFRPYKAFLSVWQLVSSRPFLLMTKDEGKVKHRKL